MSPRNVPRPATMPPRPANKGLAIVCGGAWTVDDDYALALRRFPDATVIAVNGAAWRVRAHHLFSLHPKDFIDRGWIQKQESRFGPGFKVNGARAKNKADQEWRARENSYVDRWWPGVSTAGTSVWGGARLAKAMGHDRILLCGAPMQPGPYAHGGPAPAFLESDILEQYRSAIAADTEMHKVTRSMSGWTREILGGPSWSR